MHSLASLFFKRIKSFVYLCPFRPVVCWWNDSRSPWRSLCTWNVCQRTLDSWLLYILLWYCAGVVILSSFSLTTGFVFVSRMLTSRGIVVWHFPRLVIPERCLYKSSKVREIGIHYVFSYFVWLVLSVCLFSKQSSCLHCRLQVPFCMVRVYSLKHL